MARKLRLCEVFPPGEVAVRPGARPGPGCGLGGVTWRRPHFLGFDMLFWFRCVGDQQRSFALGIQWIVVRTLGTYCAG